MSRPNRFPFTRRDFLTGASALSTGALLGLSRPAAADPPPETTRIRLVKIPGICIAPQYVAEQLLHMEGFEDVQYVTETVEYGTSALLAAGQADINTAFVGPVLLRVDAGDPVVMLAGVHIGCFELFAHENVRTIGDLRGKSVAVLGLGSTHHVFLSSMAAYVGLDPHRDINWVTVPNAEAKRLFAEHEVDAYLGFPPDPQELRAKGIGHVVVSSSADRPWSQYFCCLAAGNREFVGNNPVATKRAACDPQGDGPVRDATRSCRAFSGRSGVRGELRLRASDDAGRALSELARIQPGRHRALL